MAELQHRLDATGAWALTHRIERVLSRLALQGDATIATLSGGTRKRVALIGRNGSGKSSLLKAIAGQIVLDDGLVTRESGATLAYVAQEPSLEPSESVYDAVARGLSRELSTIVEYERLAAALANGEPSWPNCSTGSTRPAPGP